MIWFCFKSNKKVVINEIHDILELSYAKKYNLSVERYRRIIALPNMTHEIMETMVGNGFDFSNTQLDLQFFAYMQTYHTLNNPS